MNLLVNRAICLHAQGEDLKFLNSVRNRMEKVLGDRFRGFSFGDQETQIAARRGLEKAEGVFVVIFAHGGSDYVRGGEYVHRITREVVETKKFLTDKDAVLFRGKVVFCMSCDSNGLAHACLSSGAQAFVGFREIPFNRYDANGNPITNLEFEQHTQQLIANAAKAAIERFITGRATLDEAVEYFRLWICQEAIRFVRQNRSFKQRQEVAALLLKVKDGVRFHGALGILFAK